MAAGIVYHNITTATGVTYQVGVWVPDTSAPDLGGIPIHALFGTGGTELALATAALQTSANTKLDTLHTDLGTTLAGYVDGLETLETAINTILGTTSAAKVVTDANGTIQQYLRGLVTLQAALNASFTALGPAAMSASSPVTISNNQVWAGGEYETVAASQTAQVLGATGAAGDDLYGLTVVPETTSPGQVLLLDGATSITLFVGGASSVSNLIPFEIPVFLRSVSGAWKITTGANVHVIGRGNFT